MDHHVLADICYPIVDICNTLITIILTLLFTLVYESAVQHNVRTKLFFPSGNDQCGNLQIRS